MIIEYDKRSVSVVCSDQLKPQIIDFLNQRLDDMAIYCDDRSVWFNADNPARWANYISQEIADELEYPTRIVRC